MPANYCSQTRNGELMFTAGFNKNYALNVYLNLLKYFIFTLIRKNILHYSPTIKKYGSDLLFN